MAIRRRSQNALSLSGSVDVDLDHTTDSVTIGDETNKLTLIDVTGTKTIPVKIYGAIAGGAAAVDDSAFTIASDTVTPIGAVYKSAPDTLDDGDVGAVHMTSTRAMHVYIKGTDVGAAGGTSATDSAAYTPATSDFTPIGGAYDDVATDSLAEGEMGIVRLTATRKMHTYDSALEALLTTQAGYLDGIEGLLTTQAGYLDGIEGILTTIDADTGSIDTKLSTIIGHVDGLEALLTSIEAEIAILDAATYVDDAPFVTGSGRGTPIGGEYDDAGTDSVDEGDFGVCRITADRQLYVKVGTALPAGTNNIGDVDVLSLPALAAGTNNIGDVDVLSVVASATTNKCDIGLINGVTPLMGAGNTGTGSLRVTLATDQANLTTPMNMNIAQMNGVTVSMGTGNMGTGVQRVCIAADNDAVTVKQATAANLNAAVVGTAAHDNNTPGIPIMVAARANNANPTAVAAGDVTYLNADLAGRLVVTTSDRALVTQATGSQATTTEATMLAAGAAGVFHDLTSLILTNSNTTTAAQVQIRDATAGTIRFEHVIPANSGMVINFPTPLVQTTAANNWTIDLNSAVSTVYYTVQAIKRIA